MNEQYVYLHESVHKDQLRALLKDCGFETAPDTFRALRADSSGRYADTVIRVSDGVAVCLSPEDAAQHIRQAGVVPMHDVLGQRVLSDVGITDNYNLALLFARVHGQTIVSRAVDRPLYELYKSGQLTAMQVASSLLRDLMVDWRRQVRTDVDEHDGICYISESNLADYMQAWAEGRAMDIAEYGETYAELVTRARKLALRNPGQVARHAVESATWQSAFTVLEEFHNTCEVDDVLSLDEEVQDLYDLYLQQKGKEPLYAEVLVEWKDDRVSQQDMIALTDEAGKAADEKVLFTCSSFEDFKRLTAVDNGEDFVVREIYGYHSGAELQKQRAASERLIDLDRPSREVSSPVKNIIAVDVAVGLDRLREVLQTEGITLPDVLADTGEPLPLDKAGQMVSADFLLVQDGVVTDWADEYTYRDALTDYSGEFLSRVSHMMTAQQRLAAETAKAAAEYDGLLRITDVYVFRNPQVRDSVEFRMRCRIDGVQQMGRVLSADQVEQLANGADKVRMASKVFDSELTLHNSCERSLKSGPGR